jgi:hypothetical protein
MPIRLDTTSSTRSPGWTASPHRGTARSSTA